MEYSKCSTNVHSNYLNSNAQNYNDNMIQSNDNGALTSTEQKLFDDKQVYQYHSTNVSSLNQLLLNNQSIPYSNSPMRPLSSNYQINYRNMEGWNPQGSQPDANRMYYPHFPEMYQNVNDLNNMYKINKKNNETIESTEFNNDHNQTETKEGTDIKAEPKDNSNTDRNSPKTKSSDSSDNVSKIDTNPNSSFPVNTSCSSPTDKKDFTNNGVCYNYDKSVQSQFKNSQQLSYENANYGHMMMHPSNMYYSQMRYPMPPQQTNNAGYPNTNMNPHLANPANRPSNMNYPNYSQTSSPGPGYGYHTNSVPQIRPFNFNNNYSMSRSSQSPYPSQQESFLNGGGGVSMQKDMSVKQEDHMANVNTNQECSSVGSASNKSMNARSTSKKNTSKNESHPATPASNNVPSPSQTSMSSILDENDDSVSSIGGGPNDSMSLHPPVSSSNNNNGPVQPQHIQQQQLQMMPQPPQHPQQMPQYSHNQPQMGPTIMYSQQPYPPAPMPPHHPHHMMPTSPFHPHAHHPHLGPPRPPFNTAAPNMIMANHPNQQTPRPPFHSPNSEQSHHNSVYQKLMELGNEPDRPSWIERYLRFMHDNNTPLTAVPTVVKQPLDLYRLFHAVRERGGLLNVVKTKRWKEICLIVNVNASASGAYTLRRNYIKCLLDFECKFDRNGADPGPILQEIQNLSDKKKKNSSRNSGSSPSTLSSGQCSNSDYPGSGGSTPRPQMPHEFNSHPSFGSAGGNSYNNIMHNGSSNAGNMMHRSPFHYGPRGNTSHSGPYPGGPMPGQYPGGPTVGPPPPLQPPPSSSSSASSVSVGGAAPRMAGMMNYPGGSPINSAVANMHPGMRYDPNAAAAWNKSMILNSQQQSQWSSPGPTPSQPINTTSSHSLQMPMSPGSANNNIANNSNQTSQSMGAFQDPSRRMDWKSTYGGMPPPPPPPPNVQSSRPQITPPPPSQQQTNINHSSQIMLNTGNNHPSAQYHSTMPSNSYPVAYNTNQQHPMLHHSQQAHHYQHQSRMINSNPSLSSNSGNISIGPGSSLMNSNSNNSGASCSRIQSSLLSNNTGLSDPTNYLNKTNCSNSTSAMSNSVQNMSVYSNRSHMDCNSKLTQPYAYTFPKSNSHFFKRYESLFPPDSIEATLPDLSRKRRYCSKDIKPFNPVTVTMTLKSGLISETTWALNYLNIWSRDDAVIDKLSLKNLMPLFQVLIELWRNSLGIIFGHDLFIKDLELPILLSSTSIPSSNISNAASPDHNSIKVKYFRWILKKMDAILKHFQSKQHDIIDNDTNEIKQTKTDNGIDEESDELMYSDYDNFITEADEDDVEVMNLNLKLSAKNGTIKINDLNHLHIIRRKIIDLLNGDKYANDKRGLSVKLDCSSKLDTVFWNNDELMEFIVQSSCNCIKSDNLLEFNDLTDSKLNSLTTSSIRNLWSRGGSDSTYYILPPVLSQTSQSETEWLTKLHPNSFIIKSLSNQHISDLDDSLNCNVSAGPPEIKRTRLDSCSNSFKSCSSPPPPNLEKENQLPPELKPNDEPEFYRLQAKSEIVNDGEQLLFEIGEADEEKMMRCVSISTIIRNLSFIVGNDRVMASHRGLLTILGRLLLIGHEHSIDDWPNIESEQMKWWTKWIHDLREHVLVTLVNICSYLEFNSHDEIIVQPIISGLMHWLTCKSTSAAEDPLPSHRVLGCRRLALEALMRLCVHEKNVDFILNAGSGGDDSLIVELVNYLATCFCYPEVQVVKEMALAVMHYISQGGDNGLGSIYLANARPSIISGIINFIEITESQIRHVVENMGMEALQARPELMGTSLEFLRHSGALLNRIASYEINRPQFTRDHEMRMLSLVISTVLDQTVAQSISGVLYLLTSSSNINTNTTIIASQHFDSIDNNKSNFKSFLTFNDLSFCEKVNNNSSNVMSIVVDSNSNSTSNSTTNSDVDKTNTN